MGAELVARARLTCWELLREAPERLAHSAGVAHVVDVTATRLGLPERDLLVAAAWLHDTGYSRVVARRGMHALDGAVRAQAAGLPSLVVGLIAHHSCSVLEARRSGLLEALQRFAVPPQALMDVLDHADASVSKQGLPRAVGIRLREAVHRHQGDRIRYEALLLAVPAREQAVARIARRLAAAPAAT